MYESPHDLFDDGIPQNIVSAKLLTRIAGGLYLLSVVLPFLSSRLSYATYATANGRTVSLDYPFSMESLLFAVEGTLVGPLQTATSAGSTQEGLVLGLLDLLFLPLLWIGLPIMSVVVGIVPILLGIVLVVGYDKRPFTLTAIYSLSMTAYSIMLGMKSVTMITGVGSGLCFVAATIVFAVAVDRYKNLGVLYHPGYDDSGWASGSIE